MPIWQENGGNFKTFCFKICLGWIVRCFFFSKDMNMQVTESVEENYVLVLLQFSV